ncbi:MAG: aminopeptidase [Erysipelotrichales bacterium]|nr:MAG: aminopeptidase [Erysipelotrichales bacterium]
MGNNQKKNYAKLLVQSGLNVQKGQNVVIEVDVENEGFAKLVVEEAYASGAKNVYVRYTDAREDLLRLKNQSIRELRSVEHWERESIDGYLRENGCHLLLTSSYIGLFDTIDTSKLTAYQQRNNELRNIVRHRVSSNGIQFCIATIPNRLWAKAVFGHLSEDDALKTFWKTLFKLCYITKGEDPVTTWNAHQERVQIQRNHLNGLKIRQLHFRNSLGTDLTIGLHELARWNGGSDINPRKKSFSANIPSEEVFTSPDRLNVNGKVVASRPLFHAGSLIEDFSLTFSEGKVIKIEAHKNQKLLEDLINTDEGSCYLGEVALVETSSNISRSGLLFYNTLLDENAACHLALGKAFACAIDGVNATADETWTKSNLNTSSIHVDFMFGTPDLEIMATTSDGSIVKLFENGDFVN